MTLAQRLHKVLQQSLPADALLEQVEQAVAESLKAEQDCPAEHDHIKPGDPRYDGFRIKELWAFTAVDPDDNQEGLMGLPGVMPLATDRRRVESLTPIFEAAVQAGAGRVKVRIVRFELAEIEREMTP